jgi:DNA-directed RNA polymerase specialized sigma24 family protein
MTVPDIAATLGIPLGTAKARLHRSMALMRPTVVGELDYEAAMPGSRTT